MSTFDAAVPAAQPSFVARFRLPTGPIQFLGFDKDYWRLWIRGSALLALTLGIYRFWLTTDTRRFLWSNTEVLGEPLEYTGTARELLIGFLIAVAILIPFYAFIFLLALTQAGMSREDAYRLVQKHAMASWNGAGHFADLLKSDSEIARYLSAQAIDASFDTAYHLKHVDTIFRRVFGNPAE